MFAPRDSSPERPGRSRALQHPACVNDPFEINGLSLSVHNQPTAYINHKPSTNLRSKKNISKPPPGTSDCAILSLRQRLRDVLSELDQERRLRKEAIESRDSLAAEKDAHIRKLEESMQVLRAENEALQDRVKGLAQDIVDACTDCAKRVAYERDFAAKCDRRRQKAEKARHVERNYRKVAEATVRRLTGLSVSDLARTSTSLEPTENSGVVEKNATSDARSGGSCRRKVERPGVSGSYSGESVSRAGGRPTGYKRVGWPDEDILDAGEGTRRLQSKQDEVLRTYGEVADEVLGHPTSYRAKVTRVDLLMKKPEKEASSNSNSSLEGSESEGDTQFSDGSALPRTTDNTNDSDDFVSSEGGCDEHNHRQRSLDRRRAGRSADSPISHPHRDAHQASQGKPLQSRSRETTRGSHQDTSYSGVSSDGESSDISHAMHEDLREANVDVLMQTQRPGNRRAESRGKRMAW
eukprot:Rmarinus@m.16495